MLYHKSEKVTMLVTFLLTTSNLVMIGALATYFAMVHLTTHTVHKKQQQI